MGDMHQMTDNTSVGSYDVTLPPTYCAVSYAQGVHPISRVSGVGIDHRSQPTPGASPSLEDFTAVVGHVEAGELINIGVWGHTASGSTEGLKVYVDWNQDGIFDYATEGSLVGYLINSSGTDGKQVTAAIRVPGSARTGDARMRVIKAFDLMTNPWSCNEGGSGWGQAEDYPLRVGGLEGKAVFCSSFEEADDGSCGTPPPAAEIVYSGPINVAIPPTASGLGINFLTGEMSPPDIPSYHFFANQGDPYLFGPGLIFSWGTDGNNAGASLTSSGPYLVLGSGDTIGPSSTFSRYGFGMVGMMSNYWGGMNGYLGVRFMNEQTHEVNYGYVHMLTTTGTGFPAMIMDYAYDQSGAAITIP